MVMSLRKKLQASKKYENEGSQMGASQNIVSMSPVQRDMTGSVSGYDSILSQNGPAIPQSVVAPNQGAMTQIQPTDGVKSNGVGARKPLSAFGDNTDPALANVQSNYVDWYSERQRQGLGLIPIPQPLVTYHETRNPTTGDYTNADYAYSFDGVPEPMAALQRLAAAEANRVLDHEIGNINSVRGNVRTAMPITYYDEPRIVQTFDPYTGQSSYKQENTKLVRPYFGDPYLSF